MQSGDLNALKLKYQLRRLPVWGQADLTNQSITIEEYPEYRHLSQLTGKHGEDFRLEYLDFMPFLIPQKKRKSALT